MEPLGPVQACNGITLVTLMCWSTVKSTVKCGLNWCDKIVLIILEETKEQSYVKLLCQLELNDLLSRRLRIPPPKKKRAVTSDLCTVQLILKFTDSDILYKLMYCLIICE